MTQRLFGVACALALAMVLATPAHARTSNKNQKQQITKAECFRDCGDTYARAKARTTKPRKTAKAAKRSREITRAPRPERRQVTRQASAIIPHPPGCPSRAFCGCGAAVEIFGSPIRSLWPSEAWLKFPRALAAPGMVAVRKGHVFVLKKLVEGKTWMVNNYNGKNHVSSYRARSIAGYKIVNPRAAHYAMAR